MRRLFVFICLVGIIGLIIYKGNTTVRTTHYEIFSNKIPSDFDSYTIVQISDLHDAMYGENHQDVVNQVKEALPDVIFVTGDLIDSSRYDLEQSLLLIKELQFIAPIFFVTGNHEVATNEMDRIKEALVQLGVRVLSNESFLITNNGEDTIAIGGIDDPMADSSLRDDDEIVDSAIQSTFNHIPEDIFKLLLSHRPEQFDVYVLNQIDVTFTGHAHGGQFRIPGVGGLISPGEGFFPKYTSGVHEKNESRMVISRGLGNSLLPIRVFNQPEIVVVTLRKAN